MKINMREWVADVIKTKEVQALPIMTHPGIELNGNTVRQAVCDGLVHSNAVQTLATRFPSIAATTIMDLTVEAEAFGAPVVFSDDAVPVVSGRLLHNVESIHRLEVPSLSAGRIPQYLKAIVSLASFSWGGEEKTSPSGRGERRLGESTPLLAGCIGPFSLAGRLFGLSELMMLTCEQPEAVHVLLAKSTDFIGKYCLALKLAGANGVLMAEPAAGLLSNDDCLTFSSHYVKRIVHRVQDEDFMVVLHNCGNTGHCTKAMVATGAAAYHFGNKCRMEKVIRDVPPTALAMGNLDPVSLLKDGSPQQIREAVHDLLQQMRPYPNFVLSSGCDIPPHTPLENINAMFSPF